MPFLVNFSYKFNVTNNTALVKSLNTIFISLQILTLPKVMAEKEICVFEYTGTNLISEKGISLWYTAFNLAFYFLFIFQMSAHDFNHCFSYISVYTGLNTGNFLEH